MTQAEKEQFVNDLLDSFKETILGKVNNMPENWDGTEIRWYIAEKAQEQLVFGSISENRKRKREYHNDILVNNL